MILTASSFHSSYHLSSCSMIQIFMHAWSMFQPFCWSWGPRKIPAIRHRWRWGLWRNWRWLSAWTKEESASEKWYNSLSCPTEESPASVLIPSNETTAMTANFIKMGGGSMKDISLSISTSHRHRKASVLEKATELRSEFKQNMPDHMVLHWDGKVIKYERHHELEDRLAVVGSFPGLDRNEQFLAAPRIADGKGITMSRALQATLLEWNIPLDVIIGICWDTAASNTGRHQGAATAFERYTGEAKLWLACRHHVGELHIKHADQEVRGAWNGELEVLLNVSITVANCEWMWISWILPSLTHVSRDLFQLLLTGSLSGFVTDFQPLLWMWIIFDFGLGLMTIQHFHWPSLPPEP